MSFIPRLLLCSPWPRGTIQVVDDLAISSCGIKAAEEIVTFNAE